KIFGVVDYTPWLDIGTDTLPLSEGFQGDFSSLHVDDNSPQAGSTGRIQEGADLVTSGGTVLVHNGTYLESNITIDHSATITGEPGAGVVVAPDVADVNEDSSFGGAFRHGFIVQANDVTIQGLTIDGNGNGLLPSGQNYRAGIITDFNAGDFSGLTVQNT